MSILRDFSPIIADDLPPECKIIGGNSLLYGSGIGGGGLSVVFGSGLSWYTLGGDQFQFTDNIVSTDLIVVVFGTRANMAVTAPSSDWTALRSRADGEMVLSAFWSRGQASATFQVADEAAARPMFAALPLRKHTTASPLCYKARTGALSTPRIRTNRAAGLLSIFGGLLVGASSFFDANEAVAGTFLAGSGSTDGDPAVKLYGRTSAKGNVGGKIAQVTGTVSLRAAATLVVKPGL